jgi:peptide/nickel transport system permease protein
MTARDEPTGVRGPVGGGFGGPDSSFGGGAGGSSGTGDAVPIATAPAQVVIEHVSPSRAALHRFLRHRLAIVGVVIIFTIAFLAILAPLFTPWNPNFADLDTGARMPPSAEHILGTDVSARDIWSRLLFGGRTSLIVGFAAVGLYLAVGTLLGLAAGFYGGVVDQVLMRFTDTIMAIPPLLLIIVFVSIVGPSIYSVIVVIGLLNWGPTARLVRGQLLVLRESEFTTAAKVVGVPPRLVLFRHMLPNVFGPLTVVATFGVASAVLLEASLSFLGLGVRPPVSSWGNLITEATNPVILNTVPWQWMPAAVAITLTVLGVNFIGDGLRDALDPRTSRR